MPELKTQPPASDFTEEWVQPKKPAEPEKPESRPQKLARKGKQPEQCKDLHQLLPSLLAQYPEAEMDRLAVDAMNQLNALPEISRHNNKLRFPFHVAARPDTIRLLRELVNLIEG